MADLNDDLDALDADPVDVNTEDDPLIQELRKTQAAIRRESSDREVAISRETAARMRAGRRTVLLIVLGLLLGASAVAFGVSAVSTARSVRATQNAQDRDRIEGRAAVCKGQNNNLDKIVNVTRALVSASQGSSSSSSTQSPAERQKALRSFVEAQGFHLTEDGRIEAAFLDCDAFKKDPARAEQHRVFREHA